MRIPLLPVLLLGLLLGLSACPSTLSHTSARTLDKGQREWTLSLGAFTSSHTFSRENPNVQVQFREGLAERLEVGLSAGTAGVGGRLKFGVLRSEDPRSGFNLSLDPGFNILPFPIEGEYFIANAELPLYLGLRLGGHELTLASRIGILGNIGGTGSNHRSTLYTGASLGFAIRVADFAVLTPEVGVVIPLEEYGYSNEFWSAYVPTVGLGFTWGR